MYDRASENIPCSFICVWLRDIEGRKISCEEREILMLEVRSGWPRCGVPESGAVRAVGRANHRASFRWSAPARRRDDVACAVLVWPRCAIRPHFPLVTHSSLSLSVFYIHFSAFVFSLTLYPPFLVYVPVYCSPFWPNTKF